MGRAISKRTQSRETGFSLVETVIAMMVLTIGLLAVCGTLSLALAATQSSQLDTIARQRATQALESIYTARQTATITFDQIQNITSTGTGIFTSGLVALTDPGPDALEGTADDVPVSSINVPGPSGVLVGTAPPDTVINLSQFKRQILISNVVVGGTTIPNLRQVQVTIQYPTPQGLTRTYTVQAMISSFR